MNVKLTAVTTILSGFLLMVLFNDFSSSQEPSEYDPRDPIQSAKNQFLLDHGQELYDRIISHKYKLNHFGIVEILYKGKGDVENNKNYWVLFDSVAMKYMVYDKAPIGLNTSKSLLYVSDEHLRSVLGEDYKPKGWSSPGKIVDDVHSINNVGIRFYLENEPEREIARDVFPFYAELNLKRINREWEVIKCSIYKVLMENNNVNLKGKLLQNCK